MTQVTIITGARKGIGRGLAEYYLQKGRVVIGCSRNGSSLEHENYSHYKLDVADEVAVRTMVRQVERERGPIEALINNAGIASMNHILATPLATFERIQRTNLMGVFVMIREVAKAMSRRKHGRVVNFSTVAVPLRLAGEAAYASSKAAVVSLTQIAARELAPMGITVNAIGPTPVPTDLIRNVPEEKIKALLARQAIPRFGELRDITNLLDFFLSPDSDFITGQVVYLGGVNG